MIQDFFVPVFVNRAKEIERLNELLLNKQSRVILIQGEPGSCKTAFVRAFLNTQDAKTFWINLQQHSSTQDADYMSPFGYLLGTVVNENIVSACKKVRYVVADDIDSNSLPDILKLVEKCPQQQFMLLSPGPINIKSDVNRIVLTPMSSATIRQMVEMWATALGVEWTPQQMSDFLARYGGRDANPRRILRAVEAMRKAGGFGPGLNALQPFTQSGLLDSSGRPLSFESNQFLEVVSKVGFINYRLLNDDRQNPSLLYAIEPREFELLVAELLSEQGFEVDVTRQSRDGGVDIWIAENRSIGSFKYLVECKKFSPEKKVGVKIVREVFGTLQASLATAGLIVTTSYFTHDAKEFAEQVRYKLSLRDYVDIRKWLGVQ